MDFQVVHPRHSGRCVLLFEEREQVGELLADDLIVYVNRRGPYLRVPGVVGEGHGDDVQAKVADVRGTGGRDAGTEFRLPTRAIRAAGVVSDARLTERPVSLRSGRRTKFLLVIRGPGACHVVPPGM